jgi:hypothetical protein
MTKRNPASVSSASHDNTRSIVLHVFFVTGIAFGLNYLWETIQCPLFFIHFDGKATSAVMVTATLGDVAMTWFAQVVVATVSRRWLWLLERWRWPQWTLLLAVALALSFLLEYWALGTARWAYTDINPRIPGTAISALPVAQLVLLFPLTFGLTRLLLRTTAMSAWRDQTTIADEQAGKGQWKGPG